MNSGNLSSGRITMMLSIIMAGTVLAPGNSPAQEPPDAEDMIYACNQESTNSNQELIDSTKVRPCMETKAANSATNLLQAENNVYQGASQQLESAEYVVNLLVELNQSSNSFERFRTAHCEFVTAISTINDRSKYLKPPGIARPGCIAELNLRREIQLNAIAYLLLNHSGSGYELDFMNYIPATYR